MDQRAATTLLPVAGRVLVAHSGRDLEDNHHIDADAPAQRWAFDLLGLNSEMRLFRGTGAALHDWAAVGMPVVATEAGTVAEMIDGEPDLLPGEPPSTEKPGGNVVAVCHDDGTWTLMGHLRQGSLRTHLLGARVEAGTVLGEVGNSGFSGAPHLHVHRQISDEPFDPSGLGLDMHFDNVVRVGMYHGGFERDFMDWPEHITPAVVRVPLPHAARRGEVLDPVSRSE